MCLTQRAVPSVLLLLLGLHRVPVHNLMSSGGGGGGGDIGIESYSGAIRNRSGIATQAPHFTSTLVPSSPALMGLCQHTVDDINPAVPEGPLLNYGNAGFISSTVVSTAGCFA